VNKSPTKYEAQTVDRCEVWTLKLPYLLIATVLNTGDEKKTRDKIAKLADDMFVCLECTDRMCIWGP